MNDKKVIEELSKKVSELEKSLTDLQVLLMSKFDEINATLATKN
ncbi:hypothetical protein [Kluyvera ascorbata]|nr:hypothetical protein [Kluyvera ascorbata]MDU1197778.1 hypothetical protein [Kluyvera ascorbata]